MMQVRDARADEASPQQQAPRQLKVAQNDGGYAHGCQHHHGDGASTQRVQPRLRARDG